MMSTGVQEQSHENSISEKVCFSFSEEPSLEKIRQIQAKFSEERDWDQFHQPRNLLLALVGEVGELAELFQWKSEVKEGLPDWSEQERHHLSQELSDVLIYLVRLAEKCHVDLPQAVIKKIAQNAKKYPVNACRGSSKKYTEYNTYIESQHSHTALNNS